jgi:hypothetical protein
VVSAPELARAAESRLHLVEHQQHSVRVGAFPQAIEEALICRHVAALAEYRLDEESGRVGRRAQRVQYVVELGEGEFGRLLDRPAEVAGVGERRHVHAGHQRAEARAELRAGGGQRTCGHGRPWKPPLNTMMFGRPVA